jgi:hypothetical protein
MDRALPKMQLDAKAEVMPPKRKKKRTNRRGPAAG